MAKYGNVFCLEVRSYYDGSLVGYVKSVNYETGNFSITKNLKYAKKYKTADLVHGDIDVTICVAQSKNYYMQY